MTKNLAAIKSWSRCFPNAQLIMNLFLFYLYCNQYQQNSHLKLIQSDKKIKIKTHKTKQKINTIMKPFKFTHSCRVKWCVTRSDICTHVVPWGWGLLVEHNFARKPCVPESTSIFLFHFYFKFIFKINFYSSKSRRFIIQFIRIKY